MRTLLPMLAVSPMAPAAHAGSRPLPASDKEGRPFRTSTATASRCGRTMRPSRLLVAAALAAILGGCGKAEDKPGRPAPSPAASPGDRAPSAAGAAAGASGKDLGRCKIEVTGDVTASAEPVRHAATDSKVSFATDYWLSDDELETGLRALVGLGGDKGVDKDAKVAEAMKNDSRLFVFLMLCGDDAVTLSLVPGKASRYADIPRAPKKYVVTKDARAGELSVMLSVGDSALSVKAPGTLEVTRFDSSRIEGTFAFEAEERYGKKRSVKAAGSFEFDCVLSQSCGKQSIKRIPRRRVPLEASPAGAPDARRHAARLLVSDEPGRRAGPVGASSSGPTWFACRSDTWS